MRHGRPPYQPTESARYRVGELIGFGFTEAQTAKLIKPPCDPKSLRKYFRDEIDAGMLVMEAQTKATLHRMAIGLRVEVRPDGTLQKTWVEPNITALIFKCKTAYGMRETVRIGGDRTPAPCPSTSEV